MTFSEDVRNSLQSRKILTATPGYLLRVCDHQDTVLRKQRRCLRLVHEAGGLDFVEFLRVKLFENPVGAENLGPDRHGTLPRGKSSSQTNTTTLGLRLSADTAEIR